MDSLNHFDEKPVFRRLAEDSLQCFDDEKDRLRSGRVLYPTDLASTLA